MLDNPEVLEKQEFAMRSTVWFWNSRKLSDIADKDDEWIFTRKDSKGKIFARYNKFQYITWRINGGQNHYSERVGFYNRLRKEFKLPPYDFTVNRKN